MNFCIYLFYKSTNQIASRLRCDDKKGVKILSEALHEFIWTSPLIRLCQILGERSIL